MAAVVNMMTGRPRNSAMHEGELIGSSKGLRGVWDLWYKWSPEPIRQCCSRVRLAPGRNSSPVPSTRKACAGPRSLCNAELRSHAHWIGGERAVRSRAGSLHGRPDADHGTLSNGPPRNSVPG